MDIQPSQNCTKTNRQLRIEFITEKKAVRLWSATDISLYKSEHENLHPT